MTMLDQCTARAIVGAINSAFTPAAAPAAAGPVYLMLQAWPVAEQLPDADLDVLIFDGPDTEAQLGAYMGHDEEGDGQPIWVDTQGFGLAGVTHWAEMPKLTGAVLAPVTNKLDEAREHLAAAGAEWRARAQRAECERKVLLDLLVETDTLLASVRLTNLPKAEALARLRNRILRASQPLRPAAGEPLICGVDLAAGPSTHVDITLRTCSNDEREECDNYPCQNKGACQGRYL